MNEEQMNSQARTGRGMGQRDFFFFGMGGRETNKQQISLARQKSDNQYKSEDDDTQATSENRHTNSQQTQVEDTKVSASWAATHPLSERTALYATRCQSPLCTWGRAGQSQQDTGKKD